MSLDFSIAAFHFLRPGWLLLLLPAAAISWLALRGSDPVQAWRGVMAPELLEALLVKTRAKRGRGRPAALLAVALVLGILALAGPTWQQQPAPFAEDQAAIFIVMKVTPTMRAQDVQPSRLERSVQKISDFLAQRPGQRTGLIAYAGSPHLAMPLTSDAEIINTFAAALEPEAMPLAGDDPLAAIQLANLRLARAGVPGAILLVVDEFPAEQLEALRTLTKNGGVPVHVLAVAAPPEVIPPAGSPPAEPLDRARMKALARAGGGSLEVVTPDQRDVTGLANSVETGIRSVAGDDQEQWRDRGYSLLPFLALILLSFFRPGGAVIIE